MSKKSGVVQAAGAVLALAIGLSGCGGGGSSSAPSPAPPPPSPGLTGALFYASGTSAVRLDVSTGSEQAASIGTDSNERLGHGGSLFTDVTVVTHVTATPNEYTVNLWQNSTGGLQFIRSLPTISATGVVVSGPVQPSADGTRFAMHTRESAALGDPYVDHVYVIDESLHVLMHASGYRDPAWADANTLVVAGDDGLFKLPVVSSPTAVRIGSAGLGAPGSAPAQPSVSPDGSAIAFIQNDAVWRIGLDGSALTQVTSSHVGLAWPAWSPDGSRIAVIGGECPPVGAGSPEPAIVPLSSTSANQDVTSAAAVMKQGSVPARSCGPVYWTAS